RSRPSTGSQRAQPARRTFSSGQRALLWAAGVLGALAIIIAVLIVINSRSENDQQQTPAPTVTDTGTPPANGGPPPASKTPTGSGTGNHLQLNWTDTDGIGDPVLQSRPPAHSWVVPLTPPTSAPHETLQ